MRHSARTSPPLDFVVCVVLRWRHFESCKVSHGVSKWTFVIYMFLENIYQPSGGISDWVWCLTVPWNTKNWCQKCPNIIKTVVWRVAKCIKSNAKDVIGAPSALVGSSISSRVLFWVWRPLDFEGVPKVTFFWENQHRMRKEKFQKGVLKIIVFCYLLLTNGEAERCSKDSFAL